MFTVNDRVKVLDSVDDKNSIKYEKGVILYIGRRALIQFDSNICGHNGNGLGKFRYCWMVGLEKLQKIGG